MKKILLCLLLLLPIKINALDLAKTSKSAIMIEASTGKVIFEKDADLKLPPASMTKIMTMLLTMEAIDDKIIKLDDIVTVSEKASSMGGSQILLETGEQMKVEDLLKGVAVASGNDAAVALAEFIAGSVDEFVNMMNKRSKELGLTNTHFVNPHGLDKTDHYSSARDMSIMARELVKHKKILEYTSIYETYLRENLDTKIWLVNTNKLVRFYKGVDGLKTGFTNTAKYCLTATAMKNNMRLITVIMGSDTPQIRNAETTEMLDYGFSQYRLDTVILDNQILGKIKINNGVDQTSNVVPMKNVTFLKKKNEKRENVTYKLKLKNVKAPLKVGDKVGVAYIYKNNKKIKEINLTVDKNNNKINLLQLYIRNLNNLLTGMI